MKHGKLIVLVGPSGSGKSSLMRYIRQVHPELLFSVSCTTRAIRLGEAEGVNYYFVTLEDFKRRIAAGEFLEWAEYGGNYYGTLKSEVSPALEGGDVMLMEIELQGVRQIQKILPKDAFLTVFVNAGTWEDLVPRIRARAPMSDADLEKRALRYAEEMRFKNEADIIVENPEGALESAKQNFAAVVGATLEAAKK